MIGRISRFVNRFARLVRYPRSPAETQVPAPRIEASVPLDLTAIVQFVEELARIPNPKIVELGTRRQDGQQSTRHSVWVPHAEQYIGVDYLPGEDVDLVADVHQLSRHFPEESVDGIVACSVFEHVKYPWIAAHQIATVLKKGGCVFIHTHQTFALHAHPHDYWRFSTEGLQALFSPALGLTVLSSHYQYPCRIVSPDDPAQAANLSYLNVCLMAKKTGRTPDAFVPDFTR